MAVASRWPWRLKPAAAIRRATSASVKYSRLRVSALRRRRGGFRRTTVPFTVLGATSARGDFPMCFQPWLQWTVPNMSAHGTLRKERNTRFYGQNWDFGRTGQQARDAESTEISVGGHNRRHRKQWQQEALGSKIL